MLSFLSRLLKRCRPASKVPPSRDPLKALHNAPPVVLSMDPTVAVGVLAILRKGLQLPLNNEPAARDAWAVLRVIGQQLPDEVKPMLGLPLKTATPAAAGEMVDAFLRDVPAGLVTRHCMRCEHFQLPMLLSFGPAHTRSKMHLFLQRAAREVTRVN